MTGIRAELKYNIKLAPIVTILLAIVTSCRVIDIKQLKEKVIPPSNFQILGFYYQKGIWLNDSTFVIRSQSIPRMKLTSSFKKEESYRFSLLAKKPDSLNWLKEKINPTKMNSKE
jgi:hypothetical protein